MNRDKNKLISTSQIIQSRLNKKINLVTTQHPLRSSPALIGICNPDVYNIRIFNPLIALQMLIFYACGLQIRTSAAPII